MSEGYHINYVKRESIDTERWNRCIDQAQNSLIYAYSFYLDNMARHWDGLILNDYEAVMPVTWNRKWGIKYLYQPPLTPQLGIFSSVDISEELISGFIQQINQHFKFAEIFLNYGNWHTKFKARLNYTLQLNANYSELRSRYENVLQKNLKRASNLDLKYVKNYELKKALLLHQQQYGHRTPHVKDADYTRFENLCILLLKTNEALIRAVFDRENELLAIATLFFKKNRLYLIETTTINDRKKMQPNHFLLDSIIQEFAGQNVTLDFVGSDIPGIAHFYKNFGPVNQPYFFYRYNNLSWPIKLFKK